MTVESEKLYTSVETLIDIKGTNMIISDHGEDKFKFLKEDSCATTAGLTHQSSIHQVIAQEQLSEIERRL